MNNQGAKDDGKTKTAHDRIELISFLVDLPIKTATEAQRGAAATKENGSPRAVSVQLSAISSWSSALRASFRNFLAKITRICRLVVQRKHSRFSSASLRGGFHYGCIRPIVHQGIRRFLKTYPIGYNNLMKRIHKPEIDDRSGLESWVSSGDRVWVIPETRLKPKARTHFETEEDMAAHLESALEEGDNALVAAALGDLARAKGMTEVARRTGLGRESLYKALSPNGNPEFATVLKVVRALGLELHAMVR
jgi:probable addiction module antidote protein